MSMPSSSDDVATRHGIRPAFRSSSISTRCSRARLPWWARATSRSASSFRRSARRSASRRLLTNRIVERCASTRRRSSGYIEGQIDWPPCSVPASITWPSAGTGCESAPVESSSRRSSTGTTTWRSSSLVVPASTSSDRAVARDEAADLGERALGGGQADALRRLRRQPLEPLDRERQMGAALRAGNRVHLVEDQRVHRPERLAGGGGEHEVERLGRRDQDVGRLLDEEAPLAAARVACPHPDAQPRLEPGERAAQVPLDVVVQRLQRRDVQDAEALHRGCRSACRSPTGTRSASCPTRSAPG